MLIQWESGQGQQDETAEHSYDMSVSICRAVDVSALKFDSLSLPEDHLPQPSGNFSPAASCSALIRFLWAVNACRFYGGCSRWDHHVILSHQLVIDG